MASNWMDKPSGSYNTKRVFINPNFKKCNGPTQPPNSTMHINPHFTQYMPQQNILINPNKAKIHVNPNFIKAGQTFTKPVSAGVVQSTNVQYENNKEGSLECKTASSIPSCSTPIQKSRYSLVRNVHRKTKEPESSNRPVVAIKKVTKYKLVAVSNKNHDTTNSSKISKSKLLPTTPITVTKNRRILNTSFRTKFKYVRRSLITSSGPVVNSLNKLSIKHKRTTRLSIKSKLKVAPGSLKKNNIPCPLFRKYGKCLRKLHGVCEFLHDNKHVSICRKFLKGVCHDSSCLLSHDLTDKKMPTCYFYLNGMCTKDNCPYLHIKLNEKAKVCSDFLKGYCESGEKCLKRHVNVRTDISKQKTSIVHKTRVKRDQGLKSTNFCKKEIKKSAVNINEQKKEDECRYYKLDVELENINNESNQVSDLTIKPSRCKLGTLPSYIKL